MKLVVIALAILLMAIGFATVIIKLIDFSLWLKELGDAFINKYKK